jgi:hypothetical protein
MAASAENRTSEWIAIIAMVIAAATFTSTTYQACLQRQDLHLSMRPHMISYYYNKEHGVGWMLGNQGLGPAILGWFRVTVDGKSVGTWHEVNRLLEIPPGNGHFTNPMPGSLYLPPRPQGEELHKIYWIDPSPAADQLHENFKRVHIALCYCSDRA